MARFKVGDIVVVKMPKEEGSEVAEIRGVSDEGYKLFYWALLQARRKLVPESDILSMIPVGQDDQHRFSVGSEVAVDWKDGYWYPATVTGHILGGYAVQWLGEDAGSSQALHEQVAGPPRAQTGLVSPGTRITRFINSLDEDPYYDPGTVRAVYSEEYEVLWDHGEVSRIPFSEALEVPNASAPVGPTAAQTEPDASSDAAGSTDVEYFHRYVVMRQGDRSVVSGKRDEHYPCPHCGRMHSAEWLKDKKYEIKFYLCEAGPQPGVVSRELDTNGKELTPMSIPAFVGRYYAGETITKPFWKRYSISAVEFGAFGNKIALKKQ